MKTKTKGRTTARPDPHAPQEIDLRPGMTREEIYQAYGLTCPPRVATLRDPSRRTYGPAVARISSQLGQPMMPHQRYIVDTSLEVDPATHALVYRDVTALLPRQSGKTTVVLPVRVHRAVAMPAEVRKYAPHQQGRQRILYAAQRRQDAREKWVDDQLPILEASPFRAKYRKRLANGSEALIWRTGAYDGITSNTETAGHGKVLDLGFEDEFFAAVDARLEQAFSPAMITRWSPQHWRVSTEGTEASLYLADKVEKGREIVESGLQASTAYFEWSNLDGPYTAPDTWLSCMPALCPQLAGECICGVDSTGRRRWRHTVRLAAVLAELGKLGREEFGRAYLNRRKGSSLAPDPNMPTAEEWAARLDDRAAPGDPVAFAIDMPPSRAATAIVAVWLCEIERCPTRTAYDDGTEQAGAHRHGKLVEYRPGSDWVPARAAELTERWTPVGWAIDGASPAMSLVPDLAEVGIVRRTGDPERGDLVVLNAGEAAAAAGMLVDGIRQDTIRHEGQAAMTAAFQNARTRPLGDRFAFARRLGAVDISPWVAFGGALLALETRKHLAVEEDFDPSAFYV
ncbi:hypothetical protein [Micromonospora sp. RTGN7]|uniref:hypothetical protein n=1 Tax=Micromonospora sp. RTGN7 TaxID=3016526 RepID=UPI0029FF0AAC|nr:hypothetical protein [Micromonospora sp. RTGN7]